MAPTTRYIVQTIPTLRTTARISQLTTRSNISSRLSIRTFSISPSSLKTVEPVFSPKAVAPIGPYTQAIKANDMVFLSGQIPADSQSKLIEGTIAEKTHKMCQNAKAVLEEAGSSLDKAVKVTVYFNDLDDMQEMNEVYAKYFPHKPARSASESPKLPAGASMEMDIIALQ